MLPGTSPRRLSPFASAKDHLAAAAPAYERADRVAFRLERSFAAAQDDRLKGPSLGQDLCGRLLRTTSRAGRLPNLPLIALTLCVQRGGPVGPPLRVSSMC